MSYAHWLLSVPLVIFQLPFLYRFLCVFIPISIYLAIRRARSSSYESTGWKFWALLVILSIYLAVVFYLTGFPSVWSLRTDYLAQIALDPLSFLRNPATSILNILLFVPLGFLVPLLWKGFRSFGRVALAGLAFSALIEISQLFTTRTVTVDDLLMNTLGAVIGYCLLTLALKWFPRIAPVNTYDHAELSTGYRVLGLGAIGYFLLFHWSIASWLYQR
ncbi:MAG: VanZ family protein [Cellulomonadaceae bacterium]|nr:VanZ family protein [Cellulomonadaceae bacterium]